MEAQQEKLPIIQTLWIGDELGKMETLSIRSFLIHDHEYHLYLYNEIKNIPNGVIVKDAREIISMEKIFCINNSYAGFSDLFRYKLLLEKAGFWCDTDVVCLQPFLFDKSYILATERIPSTQNIKIASCVLGTTQTNTELMQFCFENASQVDLQNYRWGCIGPDLVTQAVNELKLQSYLYPPDTFCPINWWDWKLYIQSGIKLQFRYKPHAFHLWHQMWKVNGVDKNAAFPNTLYEHLWATNQ